MIAEHFDALQARIEADPDLAGRVSDTVRTVTGGGLVRDQYVILYRSGPGFEVDRLAAVPQFGSSTLAFTVDARIVGTSPTQVVKTLDRFLGQVVGHSLVVSGRVCAPIEIEQADIGRVTPDTSVAPYLYYCDVTFDLISDPA